MKKGKPHESVLYKEIIHSLQPKKSGLYVDCTIGAGGHARGILEACAPDGRLMGFDLDPQALAICREILAPYGDRVQLVQASYISLQSVLKESGWSAVDGILLDLGVSSMQLDTPERGFSFREEGPLDMRFGPNTAVKAADLINMASETELADILFHFGEERHSRRIARAIVRSRPLSTTRELSEVVKKTIGSKAERIHPATRTFQALRIAVNQELDAIRNVLPQAAAALAPGGRLAVISFHSLEDRIVKEFIRRESKDCLCPPKQPLCTCGHIAIIKEISRKPIQAKEQETIENPRSRSAKLRVAEKIG